MTFLKIVLFVLVSVLGYTCTDSALADILFKCSTKDNKCQKNLFHKIIEEYASTGISEIGIPPFDPMVVKNLNATVPNVLDIIFVEGAVKGVKNCVVNDFYTDIDHLSGFLELTCDITIKGEMIVSSKGGIIKQLLGQEIHGNGKGKVKLEQLAVRIEYVYKIVKRGEDTFFWSDLKDYKYTFKIHKRIHFAAESLCLGDKESSKEIVKLVNENWKVIFDTVGDHFFGIAIQVIYELVQKFFNNVPTRLYLTEDIGALA